MRSRFKSRNEQSVLISGLVMRNEFPFHVSSNGMSSHFRYPVKDEVSFQVSCEE